MKEYSFNNISTQNFVSTSLRRNFNSRYYTKLSNLDRIILEDTDELGRESAPIHYHLLHFILG